ncbi:TPA: hypothetical protein ACSVZR_003519 [Bacillus cereus]
MADIQFDITLDLVEKYVPAENVTVVQEDYQSVKFVYTILNREQPVDLSGATDIVVSFVKPDGHIVLQNDGTLVNGKVELVANPQAFTYVGKTYFQVQYKIGSSIYNTRQAFLWVERGNTSCQTLSSTDFAPMLDQAIQAGQMLSGIDLQALIDSKVTAENAQADVDALELRVGALEVTIVGLDSRVDALEASQVVQDGKITTLETGLASVGSNLSGLTARVTTNETAISGLQASQATQDTKIASLETNQADLSSRVTSVEGNITTVVSEVDALQLASADHESRIEGLEKDMPNLDPINTAITALQAKDVEQDGRISANETAISGLQTKNAQQDTAIAGNATDIGNLQAEQTTQNNRLIAVENKNATQDSAIGDIQAKDTAQDSAISALQSSQATQDTDIAAIKVKNTEQDTAIAANASSIVAVDTKVDANKAAQDTINSGVTGSLSNHSTRIDALETDATVDDARITNLEIDNTSNKNRIATVEGAIGVLNSDINDLQGNDAVQDSRLNAIETKNANQDIAISDNTAAIAANKADADSKITGLTTRVSTAETDIVNLKAKDTQQDTRMTAIENKNDSQDTRMTNIEGVNTTQNNRLTAVENKNTDQDSRLTTIEGINTTQNTRLTDIENKNTSQDAAIAGKVSKSGDTMTGNLIIDSATSGGFRLHQAGTPVMGLSIKNNTGDIRSTFMYDYQANRIPVEHRPDTGFTFSDPVVINGNTNLVKKTGDTMTGDLRIEQGKVHRFLNAGSTATVASVGVDSNNRLYGWSDVAGAGIFNYDPTTKVFNMQADTNLIKKSDYTAKDGRADLTLTADATTFDAGYSPVADRRGNTVTLRMAIQRVAGSSSRIVTTLPTDMRPTVTIVLTVPSTDGTMGKITITTTGEIWVESSTATSILGKNLYISTSYVVN